MAHIYAQASLTPGKLELISAWLPGQPWSNGAASVTQVGSYRFDDPDGEVGLEAFLLDAGDGTVLHVPLSYRATPVRDAQQHLVGTTEHSVLGTHWVYDGCADPVWMAAAVATILTGGREAPLEVERDGETQTRESSTTVIGSGDPGTPIPAQQAMPELAPIDCRDEAGLTVVRTGGLQIAVARVAGTPLPGTHTLTGQWPTGTPTILAAF